MVLLAMTGCRRTTPTVAMETLFELPSLHALIVKEVALASYRFFMDIRPLPGDYRGHLRTYEKFPGLVGMREVSDQNPLEFEFDMPFELDMPDRMDLVR